MTIHNVGINNQLICRATIVSKKWKYCNNIMYDCYSGRWFSDYIALSDNQKKMCRREWNKLAKSMNLKLKISFFPPENWLRR